MSDASHAPTTALVLGGGSDIGLAIVRELSTRGLQKVVLAVRDPESLRTRLDGAPLPIDDITVEAWDALDPSAHEPLLEEAKAQLGAIDVVLCAVGSLGHHSGLSVGPADADALIRTNFAGPAAALLVAGRALAEQRHGTIVVLSSIAASRARKSNFVYGSAKGGLDSFAQGLADSLSGTGAKVLIVRPGFVVSKMTEGLDPAPFATTPEVVGDAVATALAAGKDGTLWVPPLLGPMMGVLRNVPTAVWRRVAGDR